jgi:hypothetical protein
MNDLDWKQPALIGGIVGGLLSIIPGLNFVNCCFCAWLVFGGALATKLVIDRSHRPVKNGEGAQIGAIAGLIASGIYFIVSLLLVAFSFGQEFQLKMLAKMGEMSGKPEFQEMIQKIIEATANQTPSQRLVGSIPGLIIFSVIFIGFSTLGGLLGVALFEKRRNFPPPPPEYPPDFPPQPGGPSAEQGGWPSA